MKNEFHFAAIGVACVLVVVVAVAAYAQDEYTPPAGFVKGSPPVLMIIEDSFQSDNVSTMNEDCEYKGRHVVVFDKDAQVVEEFSLDESGNIMYPSIICRSIDGNQLVHFISHSDSHTPDEVVFSVIQEFLDEQMRISKKNTYNQDKDGTAYLTYTESREYTGDTETITKFDRDGCMVSKSIKTLNENGQALQIEFYTDLNGELRLANKKTFEYDEAGNMISEARYQDYDLPWLESVYEYDNLNRKTMCISFEFGNKTSELDYEYTANGEMRYLTVNGERRLHFCKELNNAGELMWIARWNPEKVRLTWIEYIYSGRDEFGNWTKEQRIFHEYTRDGDVTSVHTDIRQIVYYPEILDISRKRMPR